MLKKNKRIVVLSDGTWNDPQDKNPTNVMRMARAIKPVDSKGDKQIVFYDWGVGSYDDKVLGGAVGLGMQKNIQDGYRFIVQNYNPGDEIWLFGFSRGAYTVRCLAGFLNKCGILRRDHAHEIPDAFDFYKLKKLTPGRDEAKDWRAERCHNSDRGPVHFIGVWDTVGALGIPTRALAFMEEKDLFFDAEIGSNVTTARHAIAIDELREDFLPTLWGDKSAVDIQQVWFAGVHSDVGGGYAADKNGRILADIPLAWMASEAESKGLQFEKHLYKKSDLDFRAAANKSRKGFWKVFEKKRRDLPADAVVHSSVKQRALSGGYQPENLQAWLAANNNQWGKLAK
ncbi:MAG: DUF2235 domain-containing protein [Gammaproteobacteria bacterium]|nr:DUF2235 domain-containing protein [Gammaproteobacteria bacterium]